MFGRNGFTKSTPVDSVKIALGIKVLSMDYIFVSLLNVSTYLTVAKFRMPFESMDYL
jgi:hypothetical protein